MAGPSTRFLPYLAGNAMSGRADGYGLRVWNFKPDSALTSVSNDRGSCSGPLQFSGSEVRQEVVYASRLSSSSCILGRGAEDSQLSFASVYSPALMLNVVESR